MIETRKDLRQQWAKIKHKHNEQARKLKQRINKLTNKLNKIKANKIKKLRKHVKQRIDESSIGDSRLFYQLYYQAAKEKSNGIPALKDKDGHVTATTTKEKAEVLHSHFNRKIKENEYKQTHKDFHQHVSNCISQDIHNNEDPQSIINRPWTQQEVMKVISSSKLNTAMGCDQIHQKLIHYAKDVIVPYLTNLWNLIYCIHAVAPQCWKYANIIPLPKPGRDNSIPKNNRPVSLLPVLARQFEKGLANRLLTYLVTNKHIQLQAWNCAFQSNKSTEEILLHLSEDILHNFDNGSITEISFKDLQSAYDSVWHDGLLYKLKYNFHLNGNFIAWIKSYLNNRYNRVILNDHTTQWVAHDQGLPQGGPMMPILWCMLINDYHIISSRIKLLAFADDMSMYTIPSPLSINNTIQLQTEIDNFYDWTLRWKLVINAEKCESITLTKKTKAKARVYNINNTSMKCIHHPNNAPTHCVHNPKYKDNSENANNNNIPSPQRDQNSDEDPTLAKLLLPSRWRMTTRDDHTIPLMVRILGLYFDPHLTWNRHVDSIVKRCKQKLFQLGRIAYCKDYDLSTKNIWKLYISTIRPVIEYGLSIYSSTNHFEQLQQLQNQAMRIALKMRRTIPIEYMSALLNCENIQNRLIRIQCKLWTKYKRAPPSLLANETFHNWINRNTINSPYSQYANYTDSNNICITQHKYLYKSPLSRTYKTIKQITGETPNIAAKQQFYTSLRCYSNPRTNNIRIFNNQLEYEVDMIHTWQVEEDACINAWTDGSCMPNPGPGGYACYFPKFEQLNTKITINHPTTINYCELSAIKQALLQLLQSNINWLQYSDISIFTDSKFCCNLLDLKGYPKLQYYYDIVNDIYGIIQQFDMLNVTINVIKVPSHTGIEENDKVDALAKEAAQIAVKWQENGDPNWHKENMAATVELSFLNEKIKESKSKQKYQYWAETFNRHITRKNEQQMRYMCDDIFINAQFEYSDPQSINKSTYKYLAEDTMTLDRESGIIINKLRTEQCHLNNYDKYYFKNHSIMCNDPNCHNIETVNHFLIDCPMYAQHREKMRQTLVQLNDRFKSDVHFNVMDILFPFRWQINPTKENPNYYNIVKQNQLIRQQINECICEYVRDTNRFNTEYGI